MSQVSQSLQGCRKPRPHTASQIAKDLARWHQWASYHNLVEAGFDEDLPPQIRENVDAIFNVLGSLPEQWLTPDSEEAKALALVLPQSFVRFLRRAKKSHPELFSKVVKEKTSATLLRELQAVYLASKRLKKLRDSSRKASEADYASQVYDVLRVTAGQYSDNRCQCLLALPQPLSEHSIHDKAAPNLRAKTVRPDGALFVPTRRIKELWRDEHSPYNVLAHHPRANNSGSHGGRSSFKWQSTLCARLPDGGFEIASTFWEDKKPAQHELAAAYRQNRMATAAALRQLHALNVVAPVFGLVWSEGTVRAHVDWWKEDDDGFRILSAAYPGPPTRPARRTSVPFHEWDLEKPGDIISVYLIMRNLDRWTATTFAACVVKSITDFAEDVQRGPRVFVPWRRRDDLGNSSGSKYAATEVGESISSSPVKPRAKKRKPRRSSRGST